MSNNIPDDLQTSLRKRGVKTKSNTRERVSFVGMATKTTFSEMEVTQATRFGPSDTDVASLGEAYSSIVYQNSPSASRDYEAVYGKTDYSEVVAREPAAKAVLDEVYGSNDKDAAATNGSLTESDVKSSLAQTGSTKPSYRNLIETHNALAQSQTLNGSMRDEDTVGIKGVDDLGSKIEPIA